MVAYPTLSAEDYCSVKSYPREFPLRLVSPRRPLMEKIAGQKVALIDTWSARGPPWLYRAPAFPKL
jgi:hypothetical protein